MVPDGKHLNRDLHLVRSDADSDQTLVYFSSVGYMYVPEFVVQVSFPERCQVLAENSKPVLGSQRSSAIASAARSHRVGFHVCFCANVPHRHNRFGALSGMYFSLKYLSFSDVVVLKFMAPILTTFSGAIFLKEGLSLKEILAGCEHFVIEWASVVIHEMCQFAASLE